MHNVTNHDINRIHHDFEAQTQQIEKCLQFFEHQLLMYCDDGGHFVGNNELQPFEEIQVRQQMHEKDDYDNLVSKEAISKGMSADEREIV
jgi:hypothetical protein